MAKRTGFLHENILYITVIVRAIKRWQQYLFSSLPGTARDATVPVFTKLPLHSTCNSVSTQAPLDKIKTKFTRASKMNSFQHFSTCFTLPWCKCLFAVVKTGEKQDEGFLDLHLFLLVDNDVNGKVNERFLIFISPTNTMIISSEKLSFSYCYDTIIDQIAFV